MRPIVIAAGGTGGHFAPAEAFAAELSRRGVRFALMTDVRTAARAAATFDERYVLAGAGIAGRGVARGAAAGVAMARGVVQARKILRRIGAAGVVAFGGYPAVAPVLAARSLGLRVVLHEQNAVVGRANRALARFADLLALSLPETVRIPAVAHRVLGNPVIGDVSDNAVSRRRIAADLRWIARRARVLGRRAARAGRPARPVCAPGCG